jgi:methanethiol S-methyltransferase
VLFLRWVVFGIFHSLFASERVKKAVVSTLPSACVRHVSVSCYRLLYNVISIGLVLSLGDFASWDCDVTTPDADYLYLYPSGSVAKAVSDAVGVLAVVGFLHVCTAYDLFYFAGLRAVPSKPLGWSFLHRFSRHPWYLCSLLFIWSRPMDRLKLLSALMATLYFFVGSTFEEHRLCRTAGLVGERYRKYTALVPSIVPRPWKYLTAEQAAILFSEDAIHVKGGL